MGLGTDNKLENSLVRINVIRVTGKCGKAGQL